MTETEHDIQNQIRIEISRRRLGVSFRTNVGRAWTGNNIRKNIDGSITIMDPRPFQTGLPEGYSDLTAVVPVVITAEMVGSLIGVAGFIEVKNAKRKATPAQLHFIEQMRSLGARAGVARSPEDAVRILRDE
ncbi:VRR-NUC domain-containing protein [Sporomusa acidovorans]|uniref:VRR-NUC domain protein n=1 Tax=Sporomusa acidovorans (strain ATCC 49682 / DSM 3132 / Mol) TaxID=1123286 RepID=A0ABZ3J8L2_SPOA4|nr:VRR-NUC domain-containing protein [Sporomusa acidovorans]OZC16035.1 VRR-NUC domain protein [Sporomusa acidovorans DSM 3132]SDD88990.1 VRR-NUC domain-containing protein [Sporomusa acidovorans]